MRKLTEIPDSLLVDEMMHASRVTMEEIKMLFEGDRRVSNGPRPECERRKAYRQMRMEDACE